DLGSAGDEFAFKVSPGLAGFDTPATFLKVNRAIQARVQVYRQQWTSAQAALAASFVDPTADFAIGAYHTFSTASGDEANELVTPNLYAHPKLVTEAEAGDTRVTGPTAKIKQLGSS